MHVQKKKKTATSVLSCCYRKVRRLYKVIPLIQQFKLRKLTDQLVHEDVVTFQQLQSVICICVSILSFNKTLLRVLFLSYENPHSKMKLFSSHTPSITLTSVQTLQKNIISKTEYTFTCLCENIFQVNAVCCQKNGYMSVTTYDPSICG